ncbi:RDD family protein [Nocardia sp. NPDC059177]|uniref:RDD family protein n=1 Tax=Nocardia sp. NPDC059177 TaxID=3346759 RepID=UPI0036B5D3D8
MFVAPFSKRALAWLIDMHVSMIALVFAYVVSTWGSNNHGGSTATVITIVAYVVWWMVGFVNRCIWMGRTGQSWGRRFFDISLVNERDGKPIGIWKAFIRENTHFLDYFSLGYGWFRPLKDPKGRTIADYLNKTITVEGQPPHQPVIVADPAGVADTSTSPTKAEV